MYSEFLEPILRDYRVSMIKPFLWPGCRVLDVGCGDGTVLKNIEPLIGRGFGVDKKAPEYRGGRLQFQRHYVEDGLPYGDDSFDIVLLLAVLEHLEKPALVLSECGRVLRHGGRLLLTTPAPISKPLLEFLSYRLNVVSREEIRDHKHYYSRDELVVLLKNAALTPLRADSFQFGFNNMASAVAVKELV